MLELCLNKVAVIQHKSEVSRRNNTEIVQSKFLEMICNRKTTTIFLHLFVVRVFHL